MIRPLRVAVIAAAGVLAAASPADSAAGTITVVTSFPRELTGIYKAAFEKAHPTIRLEVLNKGTAQGVAHVREQPAGQRPEVFWASAPEAFARLASHNLLEPIDDLANPEAPTRVGAYPVNDPHGRYLGQALGGYGLMWNTRYLAAHRLPAPAQWADLTRPAYFRHVAMSSPSRSGTTHLTVETILQGEGWDAGWAQLLQIGGNTAAITERSFGVPDGVSSGQFGVGLVIDFFGLVSKYSGFPVEFAYPDVTAVVPANIALIKGGKNSADARAFIRFTLSAAGQQLLLQPKIARLPVLPAAALGGKVPPGYPDATAIAQRARVQFSTELSEARYNLVSALFDSTITFRHKELQAATRAIHDATTALQARPNSAGQALLRQAHALAYTPLVSAANAADRNFLLLFAGNRKDAEARRQLARYEADWNSNALANYERAKVLAGQALASTR